MAKSIHGKEMADAGPAGATAGQDLAGTLTDRAGGLRSAGRAYARRLSVWPYFEPP